MIRRAPSVDGFGVSHTRAPPRAPHGSGWSSAGVRARAASRSKPKSVGFWFAMGHSTMVLLMVVLVIGGTHAVSALLDQASSTRSALGLAGTLASGGFLYL